MDPPHTHTQTELGHLDIRSCCWEVTAPRPTFPGDPGREHRCSGSSPPWGLALAAHALHTLPDSPASPPPRAHKMAALPPLVALLLLAVAATVGALPAGGLGSYFGKEGREEVPKLEGLTTPLKPIVPCNEKADFSSFNEKHIAVLVRGGGDHPCHATCTGRWCCGWGLARR